MHAIPDEYQNAPEYMYPYRSPDDGGMAAAPFDVSDGVAKMGVSTSASDAADYSAFEPRFALGKNNAPVCVLLRRCELREPFSLLLCARQ